MHDLRDSRQLVHQQQLPALHRYMWPLSTFAQPAVLTLSTFLQRRVLTHNSAVSLQQSGLSDFRGQVAPPLDGGPPSSSFLRCDIDKISPSLFTSPPFLQLFIIRTNTCSDSSRIVEQQNHSTRLLQIGWQHFLCLISFSNTQYSSTL